MPGGKSKNAQNRTLDAWFGNIPIKPPTTWYVALFSTVPTAQGAGVEISSSGTGYARVAVPNNLNYFPGSTDGSKTNAMPIDFGTALGDWGSVIGIGFFDGPGIATLAYYGPLAYAVMMLQDDSFTVSPGKLIITEF